ncbi:LolA family protein [Desulfonatronovibrio magnus]|uniref:LolA family protein n=1 Tax=Desulfonatronovibrio magnus TaxID=698827 RepID=UPI0005EB10A0|nr:outer membrane lipoprotein carrier protein LolA [Desulfonatronovibrio magnus]
MKYITFLFLLVFTLIPFGGHASEMAELVQQKYESIESFEAGYIQILTNASTREQEERMGRISFQKPLSVRWEADSPEPELLIMNQEVVWNYFPEDQALYQYDASDILSSRTMLRFISGKARLKEDFRVEDQGMEDGLHKIKLVPRNPEPDLVLAYIWADDDGLMNRLLLVDFFGNGNELKLKDINLNPELDEELFEFDPPEDLKVM